MVFTTLVYREGLSSKERARAISLVATGAAAQSAAYRVTQTVQAEMVKRAGWTLVDQHDSTPEYAETVLRQLRAFQSRISLAGKHFGAADLTARIERKRNYLRGIEDGLLRRGLFVAVRPQ
jgi:hypothetical protein